MTNNSRNSADYDETEDLLMNEDVDFVEDDIEEEQEERSSPRSRSFNLDMRHRIEDRLEERRLERELNEYEFFDIDEDDIVH